MPTSYNVFLFLNLDHVIETSTNKPKNLLGQRGLTKREQAFHIPNGSKINEGQPTAMSVSLDMLLPTYGTLNIILYESHASKISLHHNCGVI